MPALGKNFPVPVVIVQHMPPLFTRLLAERLGAISGFKCQEGSAGQLLLPGQLWVAPGGFHMETERVRDGVILQLNEERPENSCRPAVDVLFRSVAKTYGSKVLSVILTGMGQDGLKGCETIAAAGGQVLVQDEATSVVWGMPGAVSAAGLADKVLPIKELAPEILRRIQANPTTTALPPLPTTAP
jgi:two-component system chemotaxis response regulator CheB